MIETLHKAIEEFETVNGTRPDQINMTNEDYERLIKELKPLLVIETSSVIRDGEAFFEGIPIKIWSPSDEYDKPFYTLFIGLVP